MRTLLITQSLPHPLRTSGGAQRTALLMRALARHGRVDVVGIAGDERLDREDPATLASLNILKHFDVMSGNRPTSWWPWPFRSVAAQHAFWRQKYRADPKIVAYVDRLHATHRYDLVVGRYLKAAAKAGLLDRIGRRLPPTVLDFDDVDHELLGSQLQATPWRGLGGGIAAAVVMRTVRRISLAAPRAFDATWVCSEEDRDLLGAPTTVLPNIPLRDVPAEPLPVDPRSRSLLFVGDCTYAPNREGVLRFVREAWPSVRAAVPAATLRIVGKVADPAGLSGQGVEVLGFVQDLDACYRSCALAVAPVWAGGGTKIKVVEALALGRPCVTTRHCLRGFGPLVRAGVLEGFDEPAALARACVRLLGDIDARDDLARRSAKIVRQHYSFESVSRVVDDTVGLLQGGPR